MKLFRVSEVGTIVEVELIPLPRADEVEVPGDPERVVGISRNYFDQKTQKLVVDGGRHYATMTAAVQRSYNQIAFMRREIADSAEALARVERQIAGPND